MKEKKTKVLVEVLGGVAYVYVEDASKIDLHFVDYDNTPNVKLPKRFLLMERMV